MTSPGATQRYQIVLNLRPCTFGKPPNEGAQEASRSGAWTTLTDSPNAYIQNLNPQSHFYIYFFFAAHPKPMTAAEGWNVDWLVLPSGSAPSSQQVWHNAWRYSADATWMQLSVSGYILPSLVNKTLSYLNSFTCSVSLHRVLASDLKRNKRANLWSLFLFLSVIKTCAHS